MLENKPASVLIPIINRSESKTVLFTLRSNLVNHHKNQICFPGGTFDETDDDAIHTALRETSEEVGIPIKQIKILGLLQEYVTVTGFHITPVVGEISPPYDFQIEPNEVKEIIEIPIDYVTNIKNYGQETFKVNNATYSYFVLKYKDYKIWGATAWIAFEFAKSDLISQAI